MSIVIGTTVIFTYKKGFITTLVFDNIDWKNKNHKGKETHNINSRLIQEIPSECNFTRVNFKPKL